MHDRWTTSGSHYLAALACFMNGIERLDNGRIVMRNDLATTLRSMTQRDEKSEIENEYAINLSTESHIRQIELVFDQGVNRKYISRGFTERVSSTWM